MCYWLITESGKLVSITTTTAAEANTPSNAEYDDMLVDDLVDADDNAVDKYLTAELILDVGTNGERRGRVIKRARGLNCEPIGWARGLFLRLCLCRLVLGIHPSGRHTREYEVEFTDGALERYAANVIAEICLHRLTTKA